MRITRNRRAFLILAFLAWAQTGFTAFALAQAADAIAPLPRQSRIVLLPLPHED